MQKIHQGQPEHFTTPDATLTSSFSSILFDDPCAGPGTTAAVAPDFFGDLNLDQIVDTVTEGRDEYNLKPFFYHPLTDPAVIVYRHEVIRDLEAEGLAQSIREFSVRMQRMRSHLSAAQSRYYRYEKKALFLEAVLIYGEAVETLQREMDHLHPVSRGLRAFRAYLATYTGGEYFQELVALARRLKALLAAIRYCLLIRGDSVTVTHYNGQPDYSAVVEDTFAKFKKGAVTDYRVEFSPYSSLDHIGAQILDRVALLYPDVFRMLDEFCANHQDFFDPTIARFDREIQFYIAWLEYMSRFRRAGLQFCYPLLSDESKNICCRDGFDLALAGKLINDGSKIVCNDFELTDGERIIVVTGPNQGGKTTFARMFGQMHYLARLGVPVPGTRARLFLCDRLFTHFDREEDITNLRSKLEDDLIRVHHILAAATPDSIIIINEIFSSTTLKDSIFLSRKVMSQIAGLDALCVCVTFLDELASLNEKTVSFVAGILPDNVTLRTYKIERRPPDGLAYAHAIAEKHRLTYEHLRKRLCP